MDSLPWLISAYAASNTASMILFVGNPTNIIVCEGFGMENKTLTAWTIFPFAACSMACLGTLYAQYRAVGKLVPHMSRTENFRVREPISDLPGAIVGSLLYAGCLFTNLFVSHVDAYIITLPFVTIKFIFDIVWDLYRVRTFGIGIIQGRIERSHPHPNEENQGIGLVSFTGVVTNDAPQSLESPQTYVMHDIDESTKPTALPANQEPQNTSEGLEIKGDSPDSSMETVAMKRERNASSQGTNINTTWSEEDCHPSYPSSPNSGTFVSHNGCEAGQVTTSGRSAVWQPWIPFRSEVVTSVRNHLPTLYYAFPRLPFALAPFMLSQFILIEALYNQEWTERFASWLAVATKGQMYQTLWAIGGLNIILCNISGTNIGATILLTKVVRVANLPPDSTFAAGIALAITSNIGSVNFAVGASYTGLLWKGVIDDQRPQNKIKRRTFAKWNILPLVVMVGVALAVLSLEMHIHKWCKIFIHTMRMLSQYDCSV
jgi:Na+/H+ antiporter NhaD/arsenite permease-like protein